MLILTLIQVAAAAVTLRDFKDDQKILALFENVAGTEMVEDVLGKELAAQMVRGDALDVDQRVDMYIRLSDGTARVLDKVGMAGTAHARDLPAAPGDFAAGALDVEALVRLDVSDKRLSPLIRDMLLAEAETNALARDVLAMFRGASVRVEELSD